jgi:hypothetical protein
VAQAYLFNERGKTAALIGPVGSSVSWPTVIKGYEDACKDSFQVRFANPLLYVDECKGSDQTARLLTSYTLRAGKLTKVSTQTHKP